MVTVTTVTRHETERLVASKDWTLLYGRRKVGKTFLVRNFVRHDLYALIKRGGGAFFEGGALKSTNDYGQAVELIVGALDTGMTVAVDEFQRLPEDFLERVQMSHPKGRLILLGSSMHVARDLLSRKSPLLGLLTEVRLSLISPVDIFTWLSERVGPEDALALAPYLRDPWALRFLGDSPGRALASILESSRSAIPALVGETFQEEDRLLTEVYEGIVRAIASGRTTLKEVSDQLHSRKLIDANDPSRVRPYVKIMEDMDLIERVPLFDGRGNYYAIKSKVMDLYYYLEEKYGIESERPGLVAEVIRERMPLHVQSFTGELMAEISGETYRYHMAADEEIDFVLTDRGRPTMVGEVKWTKNVRREDAARFLRSVEGFDCPKVLVSKAPFEMDGLIAYTPKDLAKMAKDAKKGRGRGLK